MQTEKTRVILSIILKMALIIIVIFVNYSFSKHYNFNISQASSVAIIGGPDGPTTIYISAHQHWINTLKYFLLIVFIIEPVPKPLNKQLEILQGGQTNNRGHQYKRYFPVTFHIY